MIKISYSGCAQGRLVFHMFGALAEFERFPPEIIQHAIWLYIRFYAELPRRRVAAYGPFSVQAEYLATHYD
jgi:hypothetical protein